MTADVLQTLRKIAKDNADPVEFSKAMQLYFSSADPHMDDTGRTATLTFPLPDDDSAFKLAVHSQELWCAAWDHDQWLRQRLKYDDKLSDEEYNVLEAARDNLRESLYSYGLNLDAFA